MADTTTVKVHTSTRDLLLELGAARRQSADQVIRAALTAMKRDERRSIAAAEARAIKDDPQDRAEIKSIHQDLAALQARA
jgi:Arc/MetJ-type ribon-helix-helix transcriptional regulator